MVRFALVFESQTTIRDMVQVLQPLEVGNSYTTGVDVKVRDNQNVAFDEDFVCSWGCWSVGSFSNDLNTGIKFLT